MAAPCLSAGKSAATSQALLNQPYGIGIIPHSSIREPCSLVEQAIARTLRGHMALLDELPACGMDAQDFPAVPVGNRDFCAAILKAKVEGLIGNQGNRIRREEDKLTVGPPAAAAKQSLLRLITLILPEGDQEILYRLVLQRDDFGLHNIPTDVEEAGELSLASVYDWEAGCIIPATLPEILFSIDRCYLIIDEKGGPSVHMHSDLELEPERRAQNQRYSVGFLNVCQPPFSIPVSSPSYS